MHCFSSQNSRTQFPENRSKTCHSSSLPHTMSAGLLYAPFKIFSHFEHGMATLFWKTILVSDKQVFFVSWPKAKTYFFFWISGQTQIQRISIFSICHNSCWAKCQTVSAPKRKATHLLKTFCDRASSNILILYRSLVSLANNELVSNHKSRRGHRSTAELVQGS